MQMIQYSILNYVFDNKCDWFSVLFYSNEDGLSRELYEVIMMFLLGGMLGFAYGGFPASRFARRRYIQNSQASLYSSKLEATVSTYKVI